MDASILKLLRKMGNWPHLVSIKGGGALNDGLRFASRSAKFEAHQ